MKISIGFAFAVMLLLINSCNFSQTDKEVPLMDSGGGSGSDVAYETIEGDANVADASILESSSAIKFIPPQVKADEKTQQNPSNKTIKRLIKDGSLTLKSGSIPDSKKHFDQLIKSYNAYYEKENLINNDEQVSYDLVIRIPSAMFEKFLADIENGKDEIIRKELSTRDVTEEFVDLESRLMNKKLYLKRYREILIKANAIKDIMAIEENIRNLQEELESTEGRLKYLSDQVNYSTVNLNIFSLKPYVHKGDKELGFFEKLKTSLSNGWNNVVIFILWLIRQWPFVLLLSAVFFIYRRRKHTLNK